MPGLLSEFQDTHGYTEKPYLKQQQQKFMAGIQPVSEKYTSDLSTPILSP